MKIHPVILFDGVCNFCNSTVNFVIKRDKKGRVKFTTLQSASGGQLLEQYNLPANDLQSFVFIENGIAYTKSSAALRVCRYMGAAWPLMMTCLLAPAFVRDGVYDYVAKNRYKWFGMQDQCMVPTAGIKTRFLN